MSKVSFVVPYLKEQVYLQECIQSIREQKLPDYEILVINDKDGLEVPESVQAAEDVTVYNAVDEASGEIIQANNARAQEYKEKRIQERVEFRMKKAMKRRERVENGTNRVEYTEEQMNLDEEELADEYEEKLEEYYPFGVACCRNIGIEKAAGDYVYFIDCDDYLLEGTAERLLKLAEEKQALIVTGNKYDSWFKPGNFNFDRANQETFIEGIRQMTGDVLKSRFEVMFSAQHLLIDRKFLIENQIIFNTDNTYYSDMSFVAHALSAAGDRMWVDGDSLYVWRHRNDKIHLPALCQKKRKKRGREFVDAYLESLEFIGEKDETLRYMLDRALVHFARSKFPARIKGEQATRYSRAMQEMSNWKAIVKEFNLTERMELSLVRRGKYRMAGPMVKINNWRNKKKGFIGSRIQWYRVLERHIFKKMPLRRDWVFFESFFGKSYSDSPKYLYEYLQRTRGDKYRYIWVLNGRSEALKKSGKHKTVKMNSLRYVYYASRCGYRIFNVRQPAWCTKRKGVVFLETWHGTPLKRLAFDMDDIMSASQNHKTMFYEQGREWNYLISANPFSTDVFERAFVYPRRRILEYGYPRNDILYDENRDAIAVEVKQELGIPEGKRVILYAPTWRDNQFYAKGQYKFTLAMDLDRMREEFSGDSVILLRTHYYIADILDLSAYQGFVYNGSQYEDVSRLYLASDICITDYSSVFFDFANLKRPILFFTYDYEDYADEIRGLYIDMEKELPGPVLHTNDALIEALKNIDTINEQYRNRYAEFYDRFCCVDDGHASERVIEEMFGTREKADA